jgi:hypothetical protein
MVYGLSLTLNEPSFGAVPSSKKNALFFRMVIPEPFQFDHGAVRRCGDMFSCCRLIAG